MNAFEFLQWAVSGDGWRFFGVAFLMIIIVFGIGSWVPTFTVKKWTGGPKEEPK